MRRSDAIPDDANVRAMLGQVTTATATALLVQHGYPNA